MAVGNNGFGGGGDNGAGGGFGGGFGSPPPLPGAIPPAANAGVGGFGGGAIPPAPRRVTGAFGNPIGGLSGQSLVLNTTQRVNPAVEGTPGNLVFESDPAKAGSNRPMVVMPNAAPLPLPEAAGMTWALFENDQLGGEELQLILWTLRDNAAAKAGTRSALTLPVAPWVAASQGLQLGVGTQLLTLTLQDPVGQAVMVDLNPGQYRVVDLHEVIAEHLLLLADGDESQISPDYPVRWRWLKVLENVGTKPQRLPGNATEARYSLRILGTGCDLQVAYSTAALKQHTFGKAFDCLLWPGRKMRADWAYYIVQLGSEHMDWGGQSSNWTLLRDAGAIAAARDLAPCDRQHGNADDRAPTRLADNRPSIDAVVPSNVSRVVSKNCPAALGLEFGQAVGCFSLRVLEPVVGGNQLVLSALSLDLGTSNSCMAAQLSKELDGSTPAPQLINFNQMRTGAGGTGAPRVSSLLFRRHGDGSLQNKVFPWLPGHEGANNLPIIEQVPSRVMVAPRLAASGRLSLLGVQPGAIERAMPLCDVTVPPDGYVETHGQLTGMCFDRLKWLDDTDPLAKPMLMRFTESLLLMALVDVDQRVQSIEIKASYPLAFKVASQTLLRGALKEAANAVSRYSGIQVSAELVCDEATSLILQYTEAPPNGVRARLTTVCDIGGGSVDFAVRMQLFGKKVANNNCYLVNDSIRFGANLVFNALIEQGIAEKAFKSAKFEGLEASEKRGRIRELLRAELRRNGYRGLLRTGPDANLPEGERKKVLFFVRLYHNLVLEYFARSIAGALRNPMRMALALRHAIGLEQEQPKAYYAPEEFLTQWSNFSSKSGVEVVTILTGNGWRLFDVLDSNGDFASVAERGNVTLRARISELLRAPVPGELEQVTKAYEQGLAAMPMTPQIGWKNQPQKLKESLALAILDAVGVDKEGPAGVVKAVSMKLCAINGLTETEETMDWNTFDAATVVQPWYATVTENPSDLPWAHGKDSLLALPTDREPWCRWFNDKKTLSRGVDRLEPAMPRTLVNLGGEDGRQYDLSLDTVVQAELANLSTELADGDRRQRSALGVVYETGYAHVFDAKW